MIFFQAKELRLAVTDFGVYPKSIATKQACLYLCWMCSFVSLTSSILWPLEVQVLLNREKLEGISSAKRKAMSREVCILGLFLFLAIGRVS